MTEHMKILKVGIASRQQMRARTLAIARGDLKHDPDDPKVWFTSLESLGQVLSEKNRLLLEIIKRARPASLAELEELSGRKKANLSRTLKTLERYHLVEIERGERGRVMATVPFDELDLSLPIASGDLTSMPAAHIAAQALEDQHA
jgi:predicted transcriptional regulator